MSEREELSVRAVRPLGRRRAARSRREPRSAPHLRRKGSRDSGGGELRAFDRRGLERVQRSSALLGDPAAQRGAKRVRNAFEAPRGREVLREMPHEERVSAAAPDKLGGRFGVDAERRRRRLGLERLQRQLDRGAAEAELGHERVRAGARRDDEQARGVPAPHQRAQQLAGGRIRPLQIVDHQQQRSRRRQRLERLDHLAQHPLRRRAPDPGLGHGRGERRRTGPASSALGPPARQRRRRPRRPARARRAAAGRPHRPSPAPRSGRRGRAARPAPSTSASTSVVLPIPGSPVTSTSRRRPRSAASNADRSAASAASRPGGAWSVAGAPRAGAARRVERRDRA